ncbi:MAG TPA: hypothetical protein VEI97_03750 [bacterium]|nr:hypothetical protein [bacterium]
MPRWCKEHQCQLVREICPICEREAYVKAIALLRRRARAKHCANEFERVLEKMGLEEEWREARYGPPPPAKERK